MAQFIREYSPDLLLSRLKEPKPFVQILMGPTQVGKTTLALQLKELVGERARYAQLRSRAGVERAHHSALSRKLSQKAELLL
jgi:predicted AAA+ superfamily ATPase